MEEKMISGYCRTQNRANTVCCEYEKKEGRWELVFGDCVFQKCIHFEDCQIMKEAREYEK